MRRVWSSRWVGGMVMPVAIEGDGVMAVGVVVGSCGCCMSWLGWPCTGFKPALPENYEDLGKVKNKSVVLSPAWEILVFMC